MRITNEQDDDHQSQHSQLYNDVTPSTRTVIIIDCRAAATDDITRQMLQLQLLEMWYFGDYSDAGVVTVSEKQKDQRLRCVCSCIASGIHT